MLDLAEESLEGIDVAPGSDDGDGGDRGRGGAGESGAGESGAGAAPAAAPERDRLLRFAREVEKLAGPLDAKLIRAVEIARGMLAEGYSPIVFCRFIPTVEYVAAALRAACPGVAVAGVTGSLPAEERERRVAELGREARRVLVCTDCLSEGVNVQEHFDAVLHYDLSWNPTRHEQREGRVDRYGQRRAQVRTLTYYGENNPIDGIILDVLLRKHRTIHRQLGILVPVPLDTNVLVEAIFEGLLLREKAGSRQLSFDFLKPREQELDVVWRAATDREQQSRRLFAQHGLKVEEVAPELAESRQALGDDRAVEAFARTALGAMGAGIASGGGGGGGGGGSASGSVGSAAAARVDLTEVATAAREAMGVDGQPQVMVAFRPPVPAGAVELSRTHPLVEGLASYVLESALDARALPGPARRAGAIRTAAVAVRTTLLLLRLRFHLVVPARSGEERALLAEDTALAAFEGSPARAVWLPADRVMPLLAATPAGNVPPELARERVADVVAGFPALLPRLEEVARERAAALLASHRRVRRAAHLPLRAMRVEPHLPVDVLGIFVYLPGA